MKTARLFFKIGCWSFILLGLGHLLTHLAFMFHPMAKKAPAVMQAMREYTVPLLGKRVSLLSFYHGFSLMMGILFVAFGGISLFFPKLDASFPRRATPVLVFCLGVSVITLVVSLRFFFIVPVVCSLVSLISFVLAMALNKGPNQYPTRAG